ncbi:MAG TPA: 1-deoxy-D-xylulose-5-phosphate synthase [Acholeplasmataceae bacterium]|nr:1-deoxy-D-xylulose-5-phosphate synthase [Acholeplasmataceae bacterium]
MKITDIQSPAFLKNLTYKELKELAEAIRLFLIENVSKTGGHFSSNLGTVELTIALHYVFNQPNDKLIFDVGHQAYTHKILTGRAKDFPTLRKKGGLSGFLKYSESPYDVWEGGHSSTAISAASGFLEAKAKGAAIGEVVAIIGDGSIQNGLAFSALNYLGTKKDQKVILVLNDNDMSISRNVGSLSKIFDRVRLRKPYQIIRKLTPKIFTNLKRAISTYFHGGNFFSAIGFRYFGPIDGHDIKTLVRFLTYAKNSDQSIIIHVNTQKGKGYEPAEQDKLGSWHGTAPFDIRSGKLLQTVPEGKISWSKGISGILLEEAKKNPEIMVLCPAMIHGSGLDQFRKELPEQIIDVGIAEEHAVVMASAMARADKKPVVCVYSTFLQRAYDQISHDVARTNSHVVFLVDRAGIVGGDGSTHQGIFDIAFLAHLPNLVITMPKDLNEASDLLNYALYKHNGPFVLRYPRETTEIVVSKFSDISFGSWEVVLPLDAVNVVTYGPAVEEFRKLITETGKKLGLVNARFIKPLDLKTLNKLAGSKVIVYEEVVKQGSLGMMMLALAQDAKIPLDFDFYALPDIYVEHGETTKIKQEFGLDIKDILSKY